MKLMQRFLVVVGSMTLMALLLALVVPKAAAVAVVATLVQVANTSANPVPNLDVYRTASANVTLGCSTAGCFLSPPDGNLGFNPPAYVIPAGKTLLVTDIEITPIFEAGQFGSLLIINPNPAPGRNFVNRWVYPNDGVTRQYLFPSGMLFPAGYQFSLSGINVNTEIIMRGYLSAN